MTLVEIVEALESSSDELSWCYDRDGDKLKMVSEYEDTPYVLTKEEALDREFISLPSSYEIHEYRIMQCFAYGQNEEVASVLLEKLQGRGAFRHFKDTVFAMDLEKSWYGYKQHAFEQIAQQWAEEHDIVLS